MKDLRNNLFLNITFFLVLFVLPMISYLLLRNTKSNYFFFVILMLLEILNFIICFFIFETRIRKHYNKIFDKIEIGNQKYEINNRYVKKFFLSDTLINSEYFFNEEIDKVFGKIEDDRKKIKKLERENYTKFQVKEYQLKSAVEQLEKMNDKLIKKEELLDSFIEIIENVDNVAMTYDMFFEDLLYYMDKLLKIEDTVVVKDTKKGFEVYTKISKNFKLEPEFIYEIEKLREKVIYQKSINELTGYEIIINMNTEKNKHGYLFINKFSSQYLSSSVFIKILGTIAAELSNIADNLYYIDKLRNENGDLVKTNRDLENKLRETNSELETQIMQMTNMYEEIVTLYEAGKNLGKILEIKKVEEVAVEMILDIVDAEFGVIFYYNESKGYPIVSEVMFKENEDENMVHMIKIMARSSDIFKLLKEKFTEIIANNIKETYYYEKLSEELKSKLKNFAGVPIYQGYDIIGGLIIFNKTGDFTAGNINLMTAITNQLGMAIQNIEFLKMEIERRREEEQLKIASNIQGKLFPQIMPEIESFQIYGSNIPAKAVGGDYYDLIKINEKEIIGIIADVSGKGIPAALLVSMFRTIFRMLVEHLKEYEPERILFHLNNILINEIVDGNFVTALCFKLNSETREISFSNAGHDPMMFYNSNENKIYEFDLDGAVLGIMDNETFESKKIITNKNDIILLYTDGVVEARNKEGEFFEFERLRNILLENNKFPSDFIVRKIYRSITKFLDGNNQNDDITIISLKGV